MPKKFLALAAIALVAGLTACSPGAQPEPAAPPAPVESETEAAPPVEEEDDTATAEALGVKESCELFNTRWKELAEIPDGDGALVDFWFTLETEIPKVAEETYGLFTTMKLFAIERNSDEGPTEETKALVTQWFLGTSGACSEAGVTLEL